MNSSDSGDSDSHKIDAFGPALPPHLQKNNANYPSLPPPLEENNAIGPTLPPHLQCNSNTDKTCDTPQPVGPELPPHLKNKSSEAEITSKVIGPALPPHLQKSQCDSISSSTEESNHSIGPVLPNQLKYQFAETSRLYEEEDIHGPMPAGTSQSTKAHLELEERALQMKIDLLDQTGEKEPIREEWMLELPPSKAATFGLGPRQFRAKPAPDLSDRSSWTDTPEDRAKKRENKKEEPVDVKKEAEIKELKNRDKEQEAIAKKHKRSKESLVEMHAKKKKKDDSSGSNERRPFSREVDLQVNRFDEAQKKAVLKKAQLLDTRFSAGESKFL